MLIFFLHYCFLEEADPFAFGELKVQWQKVVADAWLSLHTEMRYLAYIWWMLDYYKALAYKKTSAALRPGHET